MCKREAFLCLGENLNIKIQQITQVTSAESVSVVLKTGSDVTAAPCVCSRRH